MAESAVHIFGIRHHGPGSARSLLTALEAMRPDCVLVEGPPDAAGVVELLGHKEMKPPVALLVYAAEEPKDAVYYPFAVFSPEYQGIRYALKKKISLRFMDLPQACQLGKEREERQGERDAGEDARAALRRDPLRALAEAAGYSDSERWWENMVEQRRDATDLFEAVREAMGALRAEIPEATEAFDLTREAHMRQTIRAAKKEGFKRIAVVCGAWHAPVLDDLADEKGDAEKLKGLAKTKVVATWVPWTYGRLCNWSGYGAGVRSPGWYEHLWNHHSSDGDPSRLTVGWMTNVARLLRGEDLDASSASVIESVRLAEALAALRGRPLPGLTEMTESAQTVLCFGNDVPIKLVEQKLIVGERIGAVPDETPMVPLQQDLARLQKKLRLPPEALLKTLELDLRKETDLERSVLLHRLSLMGIEWGTLEGSSGKGTFKEIWRLQWQPEFAVNVIVNSRWGNTVLDAATAYTRDAADSAPDLPTLTALLGRVLFADLPGVIGRVMERLQSEAAIASDINHLMDALPPLANTLRYGSVRQMDTGTLGGVIDGLVARVCIGLPAATSSLNDDAAGEMFNRVVATHGAISLLQSDEQTKEWHAVLGNLSESQSLHGLLAGRATRLLLDSGGISAEVAATRWSLALSTSNDPAHAAAWIEGFLKASGLLLLHDETVWAILDRWVSTLQGDAFTQMLPLLRRTFSTFEPPERRQMHERARRGAALRIESVEAEDEEFDQANADATLPILRALLGVS